MIVFADSSQKLTYEDYFKQINSRIKKELQEPNLGVFGLGEDKRSLIPITTTLSDWTQTDENEGRLAFNSNLTLITNPTTSCYKSILITTVEQYYNWIETIAMLDNGRYLMIPTEKNQFKINLDTREIIVPPHFQTHGVAVKGDNKAELLYFTTNRYYDYMDLNNTNIYINWAYALDGVEYSGVSTAYAKTPYTENANDEGEACICFGWVLTESITQAPTVKFSIKFEQKDANGETLYILNTLSKDIKINPTLIVKADDDDTIIESFDTYTAIPVMKSAVYVKTFAGLYWKEEPTPVFNFDIKGTTPSKEITSEAYCLTPGTGLEYIIEKQTSETIGGKKFTKWTECDGTSGKITPSDTKEGNIVIETLSAQEEKDSRRAYYEKQANGDYVEKDFDLIAGSKYIMKHAVSPTVSSITASDSYQYRIRANAYLDDDSSDNNKSDFAYRNFKIPKPYKITKFEETTDGELGTANSRDLYFSYQPNSNVENPIKIYVAASELTSQDDLDVQNILSDLTPKNMTSANMILTKVNKTTPETITNTNNNSYLGKLILKGFRGTDTTGTEIISGEGENGLPYVCATLNPQDFDNGVGTPITFGLQHKKNNDSYPSTGVDSNPGQTFQYVIYHQPSDVTPANIPFIYIRHGIMRGENFIEDNDPVGSFSLTPLERNATDKIWIEEVLVPGYNGSNTYKLSFRKTNDNKTIYFNTGNKLLKPKRYVLTPVKNISNNPTDQDKFLTLCYRNGQTYQFTTTTSTIPNGTTLYQIVPMGLTEITENLDSHLEDGKFKKNVWTKDDATDYYTNVSGQGQVEGKTYYEEPLQQYDLIPLSYNDTQTNVYIKKVVDTADNAPCVKIFADIQNINSSITPTGFAPSSSISTKVTKEQEPRQLILPTTRTNQDIYLIKQ